MEERAVDEQHGVQRRRELVSPRIVQCAPFGQTHGRSNAVVMLPGVNFAPGMPGTSEVALAAMFVKSVVT
jgi:hypothetical protein